MQFYLCVITAGFKCGANLKPKTICVTLLYKLFVKCPKIGLISVVTCYFGVVRHLQMEQREHKPVKSAHGHISVCLSVLLFVC